MTQHGGQAHGAHDAGHEHPKERDYIKVAVILAVVTALEVLVYYVESLKPLLAPILIIMSLVKFAFVALVFMHLRFDSKLFRRVFVIGIVLALAVFTVVVVTMMGAEAPGSG